MNLSRSEVLLSRGRICLLDAKAGPHSIGSYELRQASFGRDNRALRFNRREGGYPAFWGSCSPVSSTYLPRARIDIVRSTDLLPKYRNSRLSFVVLEIRLYYFCSHRAFFGLTVSRRLACNTKLTMENT